MSTPFELATNPAQYDREEVSWEKEGRSKSSHTHFLLEYLEPYIETWRGKTLLDIGAGTGWLVAEAIKNGATRAIGLEPSESNVSHGRVDHPDITLVQTNFEKFTSNEKFDVITGIISFPHIADIQGAFRKIASMLSNNGEVLLVVPDFDYFDMPRHGYKLEKQVIDENTYAIAITRPFGTIADIVRKTSAYQEAAKQGGLVLVEEVEMRPTDNQIINDPKYAKVRNRTLTRLLRFKCVD